MNTPKHIELRKRAETADGEAGFMLVFAILLIALVLIALAVAAPVVAKDLQRDKEIESAHRANEYVRAIRLYYRKNKTYPPSMDALENTNNVRYLRKQYIDPLTGKNDWRIIHVGENKTTVKGFFGEPLGGLNTTGAGGGGLGSASTLGTGFGGATSAGSSSTSATTTPSTTVNSNSPLSAGFNGATIGGSTTPGSSSNSSTTSDSSGPGSIGQIMGVGTSKTGESILNPNQQTTYDTWEFIYDPKIELLYQQANIFGGGTTGGVNSQSLSSTGSDISGQSNSKGGSTSTPTAPSTNPFPQ
jgi:type II secretory pathway pseudopilin PulG